MTHHLDHDPHRRAQVCRAGAHLEEADCALILLHGRGRKAERTLLLARRLEHPDFAFLAPQAAERSWYPGSFLAPIEENQPWLSSSLTVLDRIIDDLGTAGIAAERVLLFGFSQGACLAAEYAARRPRRYGGLACIIGGLFGPPGTQLPHRGSLDGTPVFLGTADPDPWVPRVRVEETARVFEEMDARVELRVYPGVQHVITGHELSRVRSMMKELAAPSVGSSQARTTEPEPGAVR